MLVIAHADDEGDALCLPRRRRERRQAEVRVLKKRDIDSGLGMASAGQSLAPAGPPAHSAKPLGSLPILSPFESYCETPRNKILPENTMVSIRPFLSVVLAASLALSFALASTPASAKKKKKHQQPVEQQQLPEDSP